MPIHERKSCADDVVTRRQQPIPDAVAANGRPVTVDQARFWRAGISSRGSRAVTHTRHGRVWMPFVERFII